ncbi:hypothetical protein BJX99DRAFT_218133 [Aspergillus californicus]
MVVESTDAVDDDQGDTADLQGSDKYEGHRERTHGGLAIDASDETPTRPRAEDTAIRPSRGGRYRDRSMSNSSTSEYTYAPYEATRSPLATEPIVSRETASDISRVRMHSSSAIVVYYKNRIPDGIEALSIHRTRIPGNDIARPWLVQMNSVLVTYISASLGLGDIVRPLNIVAPFKILIAFASKFPSLIDRGRGRIPGSEDQSDHPAELMEELDCLEEVLRVDLASIFSLRSSLVDGSLTKISFMDLWHAFRPGDFAVSTENGHKQLYRVLSAQHNSSGRKRRRRLSYLRSYRQKAARILSDSDTSDLSSSDEEDGILSFVVSAFYLDSDGVSFGPTAQRTYIDYYVGEKDLAQLNIFPIRYLPADDNTLEQLARRGARFLACQGHMSYSGMATPRPLSSNAASELHGEIYIDLKTGYRSKGKRYRPQVTRSNVEKLIEAPELEVQRLNSRLKAPRAKIADDSPVDRSLAMPVMDQYEDLLQTIAVGESELSTEMMQLLPHQLLAYAFRERQWYFVDVDKIQEIDRSGSDLQGRFDDLVIPDTYRDLLIALVQSHTSENKQKSSMDLVHGKGRGLFILLHGPPGVGKTSTAELISTYTKRPLYSITCGDIGLTPRRIERSLTKHFSLANKWGCVLLLDEADVFLMKRDWRDINRNALVSVFLRVLEYYSGILFLTTNRIGVIDEAFKSRMHICLRYPSISLESTRSIWDKLMNRITADNKTRDVQVAFARSELLQFAEKHYKQHAESGTTWNGRQIRNAFQTAIALGQHDRTMKLRDKGLTEEEAEKKGDPRYMTVKLTRKNFQKIAKTARDFEDYMVSVRGSDIAAAQDESLRDDTFDPDNQGRAQKKYSGLLSVPDSGRLRSGASTPRLGGRHHAPSAGLYDDDDDDDDDDGGLDGSSGDDSDDDY